MATLLKEKEVSKKYNIAAGALRRQRWAGVGLPYKVIGRAQDSKKGGCVRYDVAEIEELNKFVSEITNVAGVSEVALVAAKSDIDY